MLRRKGFTLIELLVVIAIIGILAAMLFPVFARARESARKTQCLANVKNIAIAFQMYLADYDRMPPVETRPAIVDYYADGGDAPSGGGCDGAATAQNPYLRYPVVLDDCVKNRQVWRCPSAKLEVSPPIVPIINGDFWPLPRTWWDDEECNKLLQCSRPFPPGWGGSVTDTYAQRACADPASGGAQISIYGLESNYGLSTSGFNDAARWLAVAEVGAGFDTWATFNLAFPDVCHAGCATESTLAPGGGNCLDSNADWVNCTSSQECSPDNSRFGHDATYRKTLTRHLGGSNLGFMDGHAKWYPAEAILTGGPDWRPGKAARPSTELTFEGPSGLCYMPEL